MLPLDSASIELCFLSDVRVKWIVSWRVSNPVWLPVCSIGSVLFSAAGKQRISWGIKVWAVFSFVSVIKPSATSCPTSKAKHVNWTLLNCFSILPHSSLCLLPRGNDRCRHFVITQNQDGHFIISGDSQTYGSLTELIQHYKVSAIQPFGEYLTSSCNEVRLSGFIEVEPKHKTQKADWMNQTAIWLGWCRTKKPQSSRPRIRKTLGSVNYMTQEIIQEITLPHNELRGPVKRCM